MATLLHMQSGRREAPFVAVNCAALHDELFQTEVFGHEKGAFTGADRLKHGLFEVASGGTIFLDEVGDTSPEAQAKLLRVLETGRFRRLGGTREIAVDVRVVAATNRDLTQATARGHFREDLYYRLATFTLTIPPLRTRPEDIPCLVDHFIARFNRRFSCAKRMDDDALDVLRRHAWPGNVRELIHVIEQSVVLCDGDVIRVDDLPPSLRPEGPPPPRADGRGDPLAARDAAPPHPVGAHQGGREPGEGRPGARHVRADLLPAARAAPRRVRRRAAPRPIARRIDDPDSPVIPAARRPVGSVSPASRPTIAPRRRSRPDCVVDSRTFLRVDRGRLDVGARDLLMTRIEGGARWNQLWSLSSWRSCSEGWS